MSNKESESTSQVTARVPPNIKKLAEELFETLGLNMSTAINVFLRQCIREGKIPFELNAYDAHPHITAEGDLPPDDFITAHLKQE